MTKCLLYVQQVYAETIVNSKRGKRGILKVENHDTTGASDVWSLELGYWYVSCFAGQFRQPQLSGSVTPSTELDRSAARFLPRGLQALPFPIGSEA